MATSRTSLPVRNDTIAREILGAIATTHKFHLPGKIEDILNRNIPSRRATSASINGMGACRVGDKLTSLEAAHQVNVTRQQATILRALAKIEVPVTANTLVSVTGIKLGSVSTRMKAIVLNGMVAEVGYAIVEGRKKTTYKITDAGREYVATLTAGN